MLPTDPTDRSDFKYAGFGARIAAHLIDFLVASVLFSPFELALFVHSSQDWIEYATDPRYNIARCLVSTIAWWLYAASMESSKKQATLGKGIVGIVVTDMNGTRISFVRATARFFGTFLCDLTCGVGYLMAGFSSRKQALHDMLTGTLVVVARRSPDEQ